VEQQPPPSIPIPEGEKHLEENEAEERSSPSGKIVYKAILKEGEEELKRSSSALFWSGLAAGLSMGFSMVAEGLLTAGLPDERWRPLVAKFGYSAGFLIVILGRQQLFTENTLTPILPLLVRKPHATLPNVLRLWGVVFVANLVGALLFALVIGLTNVFDAETRHAFAEMGSKAVEPGFATVLLRGVFAGWLIALMVWLLPFAESARVWVIILLTYLIGIGHLSHVIAGAAEVFTVAAMGQISWSSALLQFILPALIGNIIGGVVLVAMLNHAQVVSGEDIGQ
jgi:formate/nitrite transporter FocA (FNT family)